jgi:hypothetical protein
VELEFAILLGKQPAGEEHGDENASHVYPHRHRSRYLLVFPRLNRSRTAGADWKSTCIEDVVYSKVLRQFCLEVSSAAPPVSFLCDLHS